MWWENIREPNLVRAVDHLAMRGRIILIAGRDARPVLPVGPFYLKDASIHGLAMFNAPAEDQRKCAAEINRWLGKGKLRPVIGRVLKLSEAADAHRLQEESTLKKKNAPDGQDRARTVKASRRRQPPGERRFTSLGRKAAWARP